jgi:hypothetical protein
MDTSIQLGSFVFAGLEVPQQINFGGEQRLVQHDLIGGVRVIDSLGKSDIDITWSGLMYGSNALARATSLNQLRAQGNKLTLNWFNLNYVVVIQNFVANTEKYFQVTYTITLRVISDGANPTQSTNLIGFNEAINNDMATVNTIAAKVNIPAVTAAVAPLATAVAAVPTFNGATQATTAPVTSLLSNAISAVESAYTFIKNELFGTSAP